MKKQLVLLFTSAALLTASGIASANNWEWWDGWADKGAKKELVETEAKSGIETKKTIDTKASEPSVATEVKKSVSKETEEASKAAVADSSNEKSKASVVKKVVQTTNTGKRSSNWNWWDGWDNSTSKKEAPAETKQNIADTTASTKAESPKTESTKAESAKVESTKEDSTKQNIISGSTASGNWWSNWGKTTQAKGSAEIKQHKADAVESTKSKSTEETTKVDAKKSSDVNTKKKVTALSHDKIQTHTATPCGRMKSPKYIVAPSFEKQQILMEGMRKQHEAMALFIAKQQKIAAETFKKYQASAPVAPQAPEKVSK